MVMIMDIVDKKKRLLSDFALLLVAFVWGGGFVAVKDALDTVTPMYLMAFRFSVAAVVLYVFFRSKMKSFTKRELVGGSVVGFILFTAFAAQTYGLNYTTASKQGFLTAVYVILVPFMYWALYRRKPANKVFFSSMMTLAGIGLISLQSNFYLNLGDSLTLLCAFLFAAHIISIEYFAKEMDPIKLAFLQIAVAAVLSLALAPLVESFPSGLTTRSYAAIMYLALFSTFACFTIQTVAQKYTSSSHASLLLSFEAVFAALLGVIILNESLTFKMIIGCVLIFISLLIVELDINFKLKNKS